MALKIIEQKKNALLNREEIRALFEHSGKPTPKREEILPYLEKALNIDKSQILIHKIFTEKGKGVSKIKVFVYDKKDNMPKKIGEIIEKRMAKKSESGKEEKKK